MIYNYYIKCNILNIYLKNNTQKWLSNYLKNKNKNKYNKNKKII